MTRMQLIKKAARDLYDVGSNLNKLWTVLETLRSRSAQIFEDDDTYSYLIDFPDPSPPPKSLSRVIRGTRSTAATSIHIAETSQLIPVIIALIESAVQTDVVREEIEAAVTEGKDKAREKYEAVHREQEKWSKEKDILDVKTTEVIAFCHRSAVPLFTKV